MLANTCDGTTHCGVKAACEIKAVTESEPRYLPPSQAKGLSLDNTEEKICISIQASHLPLSITISMCA